LVWEAGVLGCLLIRSWMTVRTYGICRSEWNVWLVTYQGTLAIGISALLLYWICWRNSTVQFYRSILVWVSFYTWLFCFLVIGMSYLLNELLETVVPWDDAIVMSAGKLGKLWDSLSELRSSLCERRLERTVLRPALLPVKTAQFTQFFRQVWRHTVKLLSLTESVHRPFDTSHLLACLNKRYENHT
jgi:hypothetical protein